MDEGENFNETSLSKKKNYSNLDMEDITNSDHNHVKWVCKDFEIRKLWKHHDLHLKSDTLVTIVLKILEKCVQKFMIFILQDFFQL